MVATDDGAGGDDKMEDSCNGNEATTAATLVSQLSAGDSMQVDGDGNFVLPQVDGPIDDLLLEGEEKMDVDEEQPASENATESASTESAVVTDQNASEDKPTKESAKKEEVAAKSEEETTADLPESNTASKIEKSKDDDAPTGDEVPMETTADDAELPSEQENKDVKPIIDIKSELPLVQSAAEASSEEKPLADIANPATKIDETKQDENSPVKGVKSKSLAENEKLIASENPTDDTDASHSPQDDTQKVEKAKDEIAKLESDPPAESSLIKSNDADESMIVDNSTPTPADNATAPVVTPSVQLKLEPDDEPMEQEQDKLADLPVSSINGVAAPLEKEMKKVHPSIKMELKEDLAVSKRESLKQDKINDVRSETGDDSTALTTLATAALGSAEPVIKIKNEQVDFINFLYHLL